MAKQKNPRQRKCPGMGAPGTSKKHNTTGLRVPRSVARLFEQLRARDTSQQVPCPDCGTTRDHDDTCPIGRGFSAGRADDDAWFADHTGKTRHRSPFPQERSEFGVALQPRHGVLVTVKMLHPGLRQRTFGGVQAVDFAPELVTALGGWSK